jgi:hypothetical protein
MNKYVKWIVSTACALTLTTAVFAADTAPVVKEVNPSLFNAGEVGLNLSTGYVVDWSEPFSKDYTFNLSAGAFWFPWRNVGFEANVPFYQSTGVSISEVNAGLLFRVPLAKEMAVFKCFAPYVGVGGAYDWNANSEWAYVGKAGLEFRTNKKWGIFAECQFRNDSFSEWNTGETSFQGGLRLAL